MPAPRAEMASSTTSSASRPCDDESAGRMELPAEYMFKDVPKYERDRRPGREVLVARWTSTASRRMLPGVDENEHAKRARARAPRPLRRHRHVDPNRAWRRSASSTGTCASRRRGRRRTCWGPGCIPQVPINDKKFYPIYAKCIELDIPICVNAGVPGPRVPCAPQDVGADRRGVLVLPRAQVRRRATAANRGPSSR